MKPLMQCACLLLVGFCAAAAPAADGVPDLKWVAMRELRDVRAVFPHPTDPNIIYLATRAGLMASADAGKTWREMESASADKLGAVTALAVSPADESVICLGTDQSGLWLSANGGKSWSAMGSASEALAAQHVEYVDFCTSDPSFRTVMASHGTAAAGLSVTRDLGQTWDVLGSDRYFRGFAKYRQTIVAAGSLTVTEGKVWGIHRSGHDGFRWEECNRDIRVGEPALSMLKPVKFFFSTLTGQVYESYDDGQAWTVVCDYQNANWVSLLFTYGQTEAAELLAAYDPHREGVTISARRFSHGSRSKYNDGLYIGPYVKSGAMLRANANGTAYFVVMNSELWASQRQLPDKGPVVVQANCVPSTVWVGHAAVSQAEHHLNDNVQAVAQGDQRNQTIRAIARSAGMIQQKLSAMELTVRAEVKHPGGAAAIKSVTVDLTPLLGSRTAPLFDDGQHGDGQAGDGVWAGKVSFTPAVFGQQNAGDRRRPLPGACALTVTASDGAASSSWTAVVSIQQRPDAIGLWGHKLSGTFDLMYGPVALHEARDEGLRFGTPALCVAATGPGPWRTGWVTSEPMNIAGRDYLSFHIRGDTNQNLQVQLVDNYQIYDEHLDELHYGPPVSIIAGGYLKAITPEYQQVRIPIKALLPKGTIFLRMYTAGLAVSSPAGGKPGKYCLDQVQLIP